MTTQEVEQIHLSLINGQRKQMVEQIDEGCLYEFFDKYRDYLEMLYTSQEAWYKYFTDCVISYHRIKNR